MNPILKELLQHIGYELDMAIQSDGEHGAHWLNNAKAEEWHKENPALAEWLKKLRDIEQRLVCPECGGDGHYCSEAQSRTAEPIQHQCGRCNGSGLLPYEA